MTALWVWLGVLVFALGVQVVLQSSIEPLYVGFGALVAVILVASAPDIAVWAQLMTFALAGGLALALTGRRARRMVQPGAGYAMNVDRLVGRRVTVTTAIRNVDDVGQVRVAAGEFWSARSSAECTTFDCDERVTVVAVDGNYLIVE